MEEVFEPVTTKQAEATENQKQTKFKHYIILLKQQDRQKKIRQELLEKEYNKVATLCMIICNINTIL